MLTQVSQVKCDRLEMQEIYTLLSSLSLLFFKILTHLLLGFLSLWCFLMWRSTLGTVMFTVIVRSSSVFHQQQLLDVSLREGQNKLEI